MTKKRRLNARLHRPPAMTVTPVSVKAKKLVYVLTADKKIPYLEGRSCVVYIGTTKHGIRRIASSVAKHTEEILGIRGVKNLQAHVVAPAGRQSVKSWTLLERALLIAFKEKYGEQPRCNTQGKRMKERDEFEYFTRRRISRILEDLA